MKAGIVPSGLTWRAVGIPLLFAYCVVSALPGLYGTWQNAPYEHHGGRLLLIWLAPLLGVLTHARLLRNGRATVTPTIAPMLLVAVMVSLLGAIAAVNALNHLGFALACGGIVGAYSNRENRVPYTAVIVRWLWVVAAVWMPVFGWFCAHVGLSPEDGFRLRLTVLLFFGVVSWLPGSLAHRLARKPFVISPRKRWQEQGQL